MFFGNDPRQQVTFGTDNYIPWRQDSMVPPNVLHSKVESAKPFFTLLKFNVAPEKLPAQ